MLALEIFDSYVTLKMSEVELYLLNMTMAWLHNTVDVHAYLFSGGFPSFCANVFCCKFWGSRFFFPTIESALSEKIRHPFLVV